MGGFIELDSISKSYGATKVVDDVCLSLNQGEVFSLLGPSGCGKTTLLRMIAGFVQPDKGRIIVNGQDITQMPPNKRPINTVFQNYALFPHLSIRDNIGFGPKIAGKSKAQIRQEVDALLHLIQMEDHADKRPSQISGGQKQRVAIARALINKPQLLLLDEPLAALDLKLRQRMLLELDRIHDEVGITFLYVTHDQGEAMSLSDRLAVMQSGKIAQIGKPAEIYEAPATRFVADFIGDTNIVDGSVTQLVDANYSRLQLPGFGAVIAWNDKKIQPGELVHFSIRPEKIGISREQPAEEPLRNCIEGRIEDLIYLGAQTRYRVEVGGLMINVLQQHNRFLLDQKPLQWNERVYLNWHADDSYMIQEGV